MRNLGLYEWRVKHNLKEAADNYARAIELSPDQYRLYPELDRIYEEQGNDAARTNLFQKASEKVLSHDTVQARYVLLLIEQKHYKDALTILAEHKFTPWEGGVAIHNLFVFANMRIGEQELANHRPTEAEKYFRQAMQYPENLGTGEPPEPLTAEQLYWLGNALQFEDKRADAQAMWKEAASQGKSDPESCEVFPALALEKLGERDEARDLLQQCTRRAAQPDSTADELFDAGVAEQYSRNSPWAYEDFRRALAVDPLYWKARIALDAAQ